ncbi:MAG: hypothetical protein V7641_2122 [Blastocatellia bacterium]
MAAKKVQSAKAPANGKKNGAAARDKKATKRQQIPRNAEEATMIAWAATYANRHKRFKI